MPLLYTAERLRTFVGDDPITPRIPVTWPKLLGGEEGGRREFEDVEFHSDGPMNSCSEMCVLPQIKAKIDTVLASRCEAQPDLYRHATIAAPRGIQATT